MTVQCSKGNYFVILFSEFCVISAFVLFWIEYKTITNGAVCCFLTSVFFLLQVFLFRWFLSTSRTIVFTDEDIEVLIFGNRFSFPLAETVCYEYRRAHLIPHYEKSFVFCPKKLTYSGRIPPLLHSIVFHPVCFVFVNCKEYCVSSFPSVFEVSENGIDKYLSTHSMNKKPLA